MDIYQWAAHCECGAKWNVESADEPFGLQCLNCGAIVRDVREVGVIHRWHA